MHLEQHPPAIVDKPLPPPFPPTSTPDPLGSTPTQSFRKQSRPPPSAFQNQGKQRTSLDNTGDGREPKRPPSSQSFYSAQSFSTDNGLISNSASQPSTANNNPLTSPPRRNSSLSNAFQDLPPIAKQMILGQQNTQPPASGRQILSTAAKNQTPLSSSVANQDLQPDNVNANISMIGASLTHQQNHTKAIPLLPDVDLPPEFALFRVSYSLLLLFIPSIFPNLSLIPSDFSHSVKISSQSSTLFSCPLCSKNVKIPNQIFFHMPNFIFI